jgi:hypothetical protein
MSKTLVVRKGRLPQSQRMYRAAQHVRTSTDYQQYSIENQAAAIAVGTRRAGKRASIANSRGGIITKIVSAASTRANAKAALLMVARPHPAKRVPRRHFR